MKPNNIFNKYIYIYFFFQCLAWQRNFDRFFMKKSLVDCGKLSNKVNHACTNFRSISKMVAPLLQSSD